MQLLTEKYRPHKLEDLIGYVPTFDIDESLPHLLLYGSPGIGKCLGIDTPIIMFDGSIKMVQDIHENDLIMGPDSVPRIVSGVTSGNGKLYKIIPNKGDSFICNEDHILNLKISGTRKIINISIKEYINANSTLKHRAKLWRTGVDFPERPLLLDPYVTGLWLGDGGIDNPVIHHTIKDKEIIPDMKKCAKKLNIRLKYWHDEKHNTGRWKFGNGRTGGKPNPFMSLVNKCIINNEKRIPKEYLINSRKNRLEILAGLIDTDGYSYNKCIEISTKYKGLSEDIRYLATSLGLYASIDKKIMTIKSLGFSGEYFKIHISGNTDQIPIRIKRKQCLPRKQIKDVTKTGFRVEYIGPGDYYGFTLDGDGLFLLGDFTVTHNTTLAKIIINTLKCDSITLNASSERGIDVIRDKVKDFASTKSRDSNIKIVFLDESDHLTPDAQTALRNTMETYSRNTRFILTANYINRIIEPLRSRCILVKFDNIPKSDIINRLEYICKNESIPYEVDALRKIVDMTSSDIRAAINKIEQHKEGVLLSTIKDDIRLAETIYELIKKKDYTTTRQTLLDAKPDYEQFLKDLDNIIFNSDASIEYKKYAIREIADCYKFLNQVAIKEITIFALAVKLMQ